MALTDPVLYFVRMGTIAFVCTFFGIVYLETADQRQEQVALRLFFLWWILAVPASFNVLTVFVMNMDLRTVRSEMKNGVYAPLAYIVSNTLVRIPFMFFGGLCKVHG